MIGYDVKNKESLGYTYICTYCSLIMRDPIQLIDCGHRLCQSCVNEQSGDAVTCLECGEKTTRDKLVLDRGFKNDIQQLSIECSLCDWNGILKNYQDHLDQVHPNPICNSCEEKFSSVDDLNRHQLFNCEKITCNCPLKSYGCNETFLRKDRLEHFLSILHQNILTHIVRHWKSIVYNNYPNMCSQMSLDRPSPFENVTAEFSKTNEAISIISSGTETINTDLQRLSETERQNNQNLIYALLQELSKINTSIQTQDTYLNDTKKNQEILSNDILLMKEKVNDEKLRFSDGTHLWQITNVQQRMVAAKSGEQISIYSSPFYTSPTGYKMCLRLYLNGDGNARGTHISLFFVLMRGDYDAILKFPFCFKVIFCLYDQTDKKNHIIDSFRPDLKSNSFQRPRSEMNIPSGIPKFVPLSIFEQANNPYVRDDTMFIKATIDFNETPKALLSYSMNLNPGLTVPIQQALILQENDKKEQQSSESLMTNNETE